MKLGQDVYSQYIAPAPIIGKHFELDPGFALAHFHLAWPTKKRDSIGSLLMSEGLAIHPDRHTRTEPGFALS
jgi:hypothetical protein